MFSTSSSSGTYGMPGIAVYSATKHAVKGLTEALSVEWQRHGVRVADVLARPDRHRDPDHDDQPLRGWPANPVGRNLRAGAPKKGMFRLMPAASVAQAAWQAYHHPTRLHWYVPESIRLIDLLKGLSAELVRGRIVKSLPALMPE